MSRYTAVLVDTAVVLVDTTARPTRTAVSHALADRSARTAHHTLHSYAISQVGVSKVMA